MSCLFVALVLYHKQNVYLHLRPLSCMCAHLTYFSCTLVLNQTNINLNLCLSCLFTFHQLNLHPCLAASKCMSCAFSLIVMPTLTCIESCLSSCSYMSSYFGLLLSFTQILLQMPSIFKPQHQLSLRVIHLVLAPMSCTFIAHFVLHYP